MPQSQRTLVAIGRCLWGEVTTVLQENDAGSLNEPTTIEAVLNVRSRCLRVPNAASCFNGGRSSNGPFKITYENNRSLCNHDRRDYA